MTRLRLSMVIAAGIAELAAVVVALGAWAGTAQAAGAPWPYVVTSVSGSATWQYQVWNGSGLDSVKFHGRLGKSVRTSSALLGTATYTAQNSHRCGPVTSTKKISLADPLGFVIDGDYVDVSWNLPLPGESRCYVSRLTHVGAQMRQYGFLSEKLPFSDFVCPTPVFTIQGRVRLSSLGTTGTLTYRATVILRQR